MPTASHIIELFRVLLLALFLLPLTARAEVTLKILEPDTVVKLDGLIPLRVELLGSNYIFYRIHQ